MSYEERIKDFAIKLFEIDAIKFGDYKTKVGLWTPVYCDLRVLVSYPKLLEDLVDLIKEKTRNISLDIICGVPYTALPIATILSVKTGYPMVMRRKEAKDYGTKKLIEGNFKEGDRCMIVEDVVTSGSSILETANDLQNVGIKTTEAIVILNREQGGEKILGGNGIKMHALLTLTELARILKDNSCIDEETRNIVQQYLVGYQMDPCALKPKVNRLEIAFEDRIKVASNAVTKELFEIMCRKQTNLCVAADLTRATEILNLAEQVGPYICLFKTHIDIVEDITEDFLKCLVNTANKHNFILFEDRKFADIGKTVQLQFSKGVFHISSWAKLVTVHSVMGRSTLDGIKDVSTSGDHGVFLLAQSSTLGLINNDYIKATIEMANEYGTLVTGFVGQTPLFLENPGFIQLTPGIQIDAQLDTLGQRYNSPESAVKAGADIGVVGRGITNSKEPAAAAQKYKILLWEAYKKRICQQNS